jgi:hypothetical protein
MTRSSEREGDVSFTFDQSPDLARQVRNALEDESAQPLSEVQQVAPEGCNYFSELEATISEWSFGYGVAWAMARLGDPMLPSSAAAEIADVAVNDAWRVFSDQNWTALMAEDRAARGPVEGDLAPEEVAAPPDLGQFMHEVGRSRYRRPERATG